MRAIRSMGEGLMPDLPPTLRGLDKDGLIGTLRVRLHEISPERLMRAAWVIETGQLGPDSRMSMEGGQVLDFPPGRALSTR